MNGMERLTSRHKKRSSDAGMNARTFHTGKTVRNTEYRGNPVERDISAENDQMIR